MTINYTNCSKVFLLLFVSTKITLTTNAPRHDVSAPNALVMPRPSLCHQVSNALLKSSSITPESFFI